MSKFIIGRRYKSTQGTQVVTCIGVTSGGLPYFEWPSGSHGGVSERAINKLRVIDISWKEVPMETKIEFKPGDIVKCLFPNEYGEVRVTDVETTRVWFETKVGKLFCRADQLEFIRRANDTFIVGQKYKDTKSKDSTMIVLAVSPADPKRFYVEYLNSPHTAGSVFLHDAHKWEIYKEPIKVVRYFNVYKDSVMDHRSREKADQSMRTVDKRIACKRVEFTEGEFDD